MKTTTVSIILVATIIAACNTTKKASAPITVATPVAPVIDEPKVSAKAENGIYVPGEEELAAVRPQFSDATLAQLKDGYAVYTQGACISCHGAKNIYKRPTSSWKGIIDDMAEKANLSPAAKDAVYKYVLAIKATQAKTQQWNRLD